LSADLRILTICLYLSYQKEAEDLNENFSGMSFIELYSKCRAEFLVTSDLGLKANLTEFFDHKLLKKKKGRDGAQYLTIPLKNSELSLFLESVESSD
jgi:origin recognition complex subunit 2